MRRSVAPLLLASVMLLGGCEERQAKRAVAETLLDPGAATFRDVQPGHAPKTFCGFVNGKNRMGAYVGFSPFVVSGGHPLVWAGDPRETYRAARTGHMSADDWGGMVAACYLTRDWRRDCPQPPPAELTKPGAFCEALLKKPVDFDALDREAGPD